MKRRIRIKYRNFKRSVVSSLVTISLFVTLSLLVALPMQDAFTQVLIAHANEEIQTQKILVLSENNQDMDKELKRWRKEFDNEVTKAFTDKKAEDWKEFQRMAKAIAPIYDYPVNVLLAQGALESARGTSTWAVQRNNFFGYRCFDGREAEMCAWFTSPYEGIIEYIRLIRDQYPAAYAARKNPEEMIRLIKAGGYASDPLYVQKVMSMPEWSIK